VRAAIPLAVALVLVLAAAEAVVAHGGSPGLIAEPNPVNPGGTVEVRGDNLGSDEAVSIVLIADGREIALVSATTDGEGHLTVFATVPADLPVARYSIQAQTESGYAAGGSIELAGVPIVGQQGGGDPYERGPIASVPAVQPPAGPATVPMSAPGAQPTAAADVLVLVAALVLPLALVLGVVGWRRRALARR
jgi:hypothetical protein